MFEELFFEVRQKLDQLIRGQIVTLHVYTLNNQNHTCLTPF